MEKLSEKIKYLWILLSAVTGLIIGVPSYILISPKNGSISLIIPLILVSIFGFYSYLRYLNWAFKLDEDHFYREHGVFKKVNSMVPYVRIQHIDTNRGPLERLIGLSTVRIYTAGSKGADIKIPGLEKQRAEKIQEELRKVAIESEKGLDAV